MNNNEKSYLFSWVRKGIGNQISEVDNLAQGNGSVLERPSVQLSMQLNATSVSDENNQIKSTQTKEFLIVGPGDVLNINSNSVMNFYPPSGHENFPVEYKPYIEFWEPDFAWRYTPACASADGKLRPWLAVVACPTSKCSVLKNANGTSIVTFDVKTEEEYLRIFPDPADIWKSAHAQGPDQGGKNSKAEFCRIIGVSGTTLDKHVEHTAFVIPVFETTRLRGIGCEDDIKETMAQKPAWEQSFLAQQDRKYPFSFPAFFSWNFKTGDETFETLVKALKPFSTNKSGINVDVTDLGEGMSYSVLGGEKEKMRTSIVMPAATQTTANMPEKAFPTPKADEEYDETILFGRLKELLDKSSVFKENKQLIDGTYQEEYDGEDPVVVPPIYGGKHAMATGFDVENPSWLERVNLDLHYRAAAGLGKKIIQEHQEQFVNRAWKQIEVVKALNSELHKKLLSSEVNNSLKNRNYRGVFNRENLGENQQENEKFIQNLMMSLNSMKSTKVGDLSIESILNERRFPSTFATPTFQSKTQQLSSKLERIQQLSPESDKLDLSSLIEKISKNDFYKIPKPMDFSYFSVESLDFYAYQVLLHSRLYIEKLITKKEKEALHTDSDVKMNGMHRWPIFDFLSIHKRAPQYIKWDKLNYSDLKGLSDTVYKFLRKPPYFASYEQFVSAVDHNFRPQRLLIKSRWDFLSEYADGWYDVTKITLENGGTQELRKIGFACDPQELQNVIDKISDAPSYGCFHARHEGDSIELGEIIGLSSNVYKSIFGEVERIITKIDKTATLGEKYYFVDRDALIKKIKEAPEDSPLRSYVSLGSVFDNKFVDFEEAKRMYSDVGVELNVPDVINIRVIALTNEEFVYENIHEITSVYDWVSEYIQKDDKDPAIQAYNQYKAFRANITPATFAPIVEPNDKKLDEFETGVDDSTHVANDASINAVTNYFKAFLDAKNEELRAEFIDDCLNSKFPIIAYPQFPEPTYYYLKQLADKFILPCIDDIPEDTISMFKSNEAFVEAFLCGMNTEMGRELLWREYPTDQRGSYFRKFWDTETSINNILDFNFFDIKSVHTWENDLGENHNPTKSQLLMFVIRGKLMKVFPDTEIYLHKAKLVNTKNGGKAVQPIETNASNEFVYGDGSKDKIILKPVAQAFFRDDIYVVGFKIPFEKAIGSPNGPNYGYMLVFKQMMENLNFQYNTTEGCKNSYQYAYNADAKQDAKDENDVPLEVTTQAVVRPYISAKHVLTYAQKVER